MTTPEPPQPAASDPDELVTTREIAARLGVPENTVYSWRHRGVLPDPDSSRGPQGGVYLWRWSTICRLELPPRRGRVVGRPQA